MNANAVEQAPSNDAAEPAEVGPGAALREARERKGLDVLSVANQLNLHRQIIEALEADDFETLPEAIFVRGYLRNYARMLGLPPEVMIARFEKAANVAPVETTAAQNERLRNVGADESSGGRVGLIVALLLLVAAAGGGGFVWWQQNQHSFIGGDSEPAAAVEPAPIEEPEPPFEVSAAHVEPAVEMALPEPEAPVYEVAEPQPEQEPEPMAESEPVEAAPVEPAVAEAEPEPEPEPEPEVAETETAPEAEPETVVETIALESAPPAEGHTQLRASFSEDCWSEITDAEGTKLLFRLAKAGETITVEGTPPIKVLFGRANAVTLEVDGLPFDIAPYSQANITRLTLGEIDPEADAAAAAQ